MVLGSAAAALNLWAWSCIEGSRHRKVENHCLKGREPSWPGQKDDARTPPPIAQPARKQDLSLTTTRNMQFLETTQVIKEMGSLLE